MKEVRMACFVSVTTVLRSPLQETIAHGETSQGGALQRNLTQEGDRLKTGGYYSVGRTSCQTDHWVPRYVTNRSPSPLLGMK